MVPTVPYSGAVCEAKDAEVVGEVDAVWYPSVVELSVSGLDAGVDSGIGENGYVVNVTT